MIETAAVSQTMYHSVRSVRPVRCLGRTRGGSSHLEMQVYIYCPVEAAGSTGTDTILVDCRPADILCVQAASGIVPGVVGAEVKSKV